MVPKANLVTRLQDCELQHYKMTEATEDAYRSKDEVVVPLRISSKHGVIFDWCQCDRST